MFSIAEKQMIASRVEELLLSLKHPEMPDEKPSFRLHIDGRYAWSWADIEPNWKFNDELPPVNVWNECAREVLDGSDPLQE